MTEFTPFLSTLGGVLIGLSAIILMAFNGKIAGATGILGGVLPPVSSDWAWRAAFLAGAVIAPVLIVNLTSFKIDVTIPVSDLWILIGGVVVGVGVVFGSGCTSGHGICGLARDFHRPDGLYRTPHRWGALSHAEADFRRDCRYGVWDGHCDFRHGQSGQSDELF